jgi:DeoR family glycerol-3-phosphate regulon repressor
MPAPDLPPVQHRIARDRRAKDAVANAAIALVPAGAQIFVGAGSTTLALAVRLVELPSRSCFVTNMLDIAQLLTHGGRHQVHLLGGEVNGETRATSGGDMLVDLKRWLFDLVIVGAASIDAQHGLLGPTAAFGGLLETLRERSRERMVLADNTKFTVPGRQVLWPWTAITILVTDRRPPAAVEQAAKAAGTKLVMA